MDNLIQRQAGIKTNLRRCDTENAEAATIQFPKQIIGEEPKTRTERSQHDNIGLLPEGWAGATTIGYDYEAYDYFHKLAMPYEGMVST